MRAKEFIVESATTHLTHTELAALLKKDCGLYLANSSPKNQLWRGIEGRGPLLLNAPLVKREQSYTKFAANQALSALMAADGFKATRMDTFCITSRSHASMFGNEYCIFPVGEYSLTYHNAKELESQYDRYTSREHIMSVHGFTDLGDGGWQRLAITSSEEYDVYIRRDVDAEWLANLFWQKYKNCFYQTLNPDDTSGAEIMLAGTTAHLVDPWQYTKTEWNEFLGLLYGNAQ